jgi:hypothetical protein
VPSLIELASRTFANNFMFAEIEKLYELPDYLREKVLHAQERHKWHDTCAICKVWYVDEPIDVNGSRCIEWYDSLYGNDAVPIWRGVCSWGCVDKWKAKCEEMLGETKDTGIN